MKRLIGDRGSWWLAAFAAAALPFLVLLPLGVVWLWERQGFVYWFLATAVCFLAAGLLFRQANKPVGPRVIPKADKDDGPAAEPETGPDAGWTPNDKIAWQKVRGFAAQTSGRMLIDQRSLLATGRAVIEDVARHYHPERTDPLWHFTLPEALLLTERISHRIRALTIAAVPGSRSVRIGDVLRLYRAKRTVESVAQSANGPWRTIRMVINPVQSVAAELSRGLQGFATEGLSSLMLDRMARIVVEEIGREAINLYSGRLRADIAELADLHPAAVANPAAPGVALRILVAGKVNAGKSSLVNALCGDVVAAVDVLAATGQPTSHSIRGADDWPALELIDCAGLEHETAIPKLVALAEACDLILWVAPANDGARDLDRRLLDAVRGHFAARPSFRAPPIVVVMSHIDRLRPFNEWSPPYDVAAPTSRKEETIRAALDAVAEALGVAATDIVPARLDAGALYNVDAIWTAVLARVPDARQSQLIRLLRLAGSSGGVAGVARQIVTGGRLLSGLVIEGIITPGKRGG
jgi:predicted GTPase